MLHQPKRWSLRTSGSVLQKRPSEVSAVNQSWVHRRDRAEICILPCLLYQSMNGYGFFSNVKTIPEWVRFLVSDQEGFHNSKKLRDRWLFFEDNRTVKAEIQLLIDEFYKNITIERRNLNFHSFYLMESKDFIEYQRRNLWWRKGTDTRAHDPAPSTPGF